MDEEVRAADSKETEAATDPVTSEYGKEMLRSYALRESARYFQGKSAEKVELSPVLYLEPEGASVEFRIGITTKYILKDIPEFVQQFHRHARVSYGKKLEFLHDRSAFSHDSLAMLDFCVHMVEELERLKSPVLEMPENRRKLPLTPRFLQELAGLCVGKTILIQMGRPREFKVVREDPRLEVYISKSDGGVLVQTEFFLLEEGTEGLIVQVGDTLYLCGEEYSADCGAFLRQCARAEEQELFIAEKDLAVLGVSVLPILQNYCDVRMPEGLLTEFIPEEAHVRIYIEQGRNDMLLCRLETEYGDRVYNIFEPVRLGDTYRDVARESAAMQAVRRFFPKIYRKERYFALDIDEEFFEFLEEGNAVLSQVGEVWMSEDLRKLKISRPPRVSAGISIKSDLLSLQITSDELPYEELGRLLESYRLKKRFFRLENGQFIRLEDNSLSTISELLDGLHLTGKDLKAEEILLPRYRAAYLDAVLRGSGEGVQMTRDQGFRALVRRIKSVEDGEYEIPQGMQETLRDYQKVGYQWMRTLDSMGFGGILADDMGLGKTLQVITLLQAYRLEEAEKTEPVLVVCPASLIYNWQSELDRFAPELDKEVIAGSAAERSEQLRRVWQRPGCILITSYDLLKRDLALYQEHVFRYQILDEAQMIKNHLTQAARSVKKIQAVSRFALTGTPIENRLSELWSIFDYLMPGMLYSYPKFQKEFEGPIVKNADDRIAERLRRMIRPFILRRLKNDVLKELPDKNEITVYAGMQEEQRKLYDAGVYQLRESLNAEGDTPSKLQILAQLMRLRQVCCDPGLIYENYGGGSAKLEACMQLVGEAVGGGHKVLIFSQFTSMLEILAEQLQKQGITYYMLTGSVQKEKRAEMVRDFHVDDTQIFLISLKAGGTGLNLTAADIVIHYDPWWNLAAQNQATDRAYRIGQKHKVTVFRLIAKNTIEERILEMQESKQQLSKQIISEEQFSMEYLSPKMLEEILQ